MRTLFLLVAMLLAFPAHAGTAFFMYEIDKGNMHKQCVYDYLGEEFVITISSVKLCPMTIEV
jgi:hypothetical protein